ncbi:MAG: hypothetical protein EA396_14135, partial [Anaerolineaceae bacterium]
MNTNTLTARFMMPHPGQKRILTAPQTYRVVACGRRFGKTTAGQMALVQTALMGGAGWWLSPTYGMANQVWRDLKAALGRAATNISESERRIELPTGGSISIRSAHNPDLLRGAGLDLAVLDEAAFMEGRVWPSVVRPMLLDRGGGALFLSTPFGRNWFWELFKLGIDPQEPRWASFHFPSDANPAITADDLADIRRTTPERIYREEYLAQFIDDAGQVFRDIHRAATAQPAHPIDGRRYVAGVDWGREHDYTAIAVIDAATGVMVALDRFTGIGWAVQRGRLKALCDRWRPAVIWAEANSIGAVNIEALQAEGLPVRPFHTTARSKAHIIEGLALALEREEITLLDDDVLKGELAGYTLERMAGGGYRYNAPSGGHDDTVIALALAWYAARSGGFR